MSDFEILQKYLKNILSKVNTAVCNIASTMGILAAPGQGITINTSVNLGDDVAGTTEPGVLTSDRYINQNGFDLKFIGVQDGVATTVEILADGSIAFNQGEGSDLKNHMSLYPLQQTEGNTPFYFGLSSNPNTTIDRNNDMAVFGWNLDGVQNRVSNLDVGFGIAIEHNYELTGNEYNELHIVHTDIGGTHRRPFTLFLQRDDPDAWVGAFHMLDFQFRGPATADPFYARINRVSTSTVQFLMADNVNSKGISMFANPNGGVFQISHYGGGNVTFNTFDFIETRVNYLNWTVSPNAMTTIAGRDGSGYLGTMSPGTGLEISSGTLRLTSTGVAANTYLAPTSITVDAQGRITAIS